MLKLIFVCNNKRAIFNVYTKEQVGESPIVDYNDIVSDKMNYIDVEYIFSTWGMPSLSKEEITKFLPKLKAVFYGAGSVQSFAKPFLENGVRVFSAWGANAVPVAEFTAAQIILANKGYFNMQKFYKSQGFHLAREYGNKFPSNYNVKVGILGAGMIGKYVIKLLKAYDIDVYLFDSFVSQEKADELGVKKSDLKYIFENCQTISNHLANNEQTKGIIDYSLLSTMKDNATFINTGRGAQVVSSDLVKAMTEEPKRTALLDVTNPEPLDKDDPLWNCPNVYITPHRAGSVTNEIFRMGEYMIEEYENFISNNPTNYEVTLEMLKIMA